MMISNPNEPTFLFDDLPLHWQMTRCEKYGLDSLLRAAKPDVGIEIGTYQGGSLQVISEYCRKVYSIDISPEPRKLLAEDFPHVEFFTGDSRTMIPEALGEIRKEHERLGFVLIDGDHTTEGVQSDIEMILHHEPNAPVFIVMHDSFHPPCREGILSAAWEDCPHVHFVEVDFIPGVFHLKAFDTALPRTMYGGLALALMLPERRSENLVVHQSQRGLYEAVLRNSRYVKFRKFRDHLRRSLARILR